MFGVNKNPCLKLEFHKNKNIHQRITESISSPVTLQRHRHGPEVCRKLFIYSDLIIDSDKKWKKKDHLPVSHCSFRPSLKESGTLVAMWANISCWHSTALSRFLKLSRWLLYNTCRGFLHLQLRMAHGETVLLCSFSKVPFSNHLLS